VTERELLVDCLRRLNRAGISYMLTGSMVSNYWGIPRTTHDLGFVIQLPPSDISKMVDAFRGDFVLDEAAIRAGCQPPFQFNVIDYLRRWAGELKVSVTLEDLLAGRIRPKAT